MWPRESHDAGNSCWSSVNNADVTGLQNTVVVLHKAKAPANLASVVCQKPHLCSLSLFQIFPMLAFFFFHSVHLFLFCSSVPLFAHFCFDLASFHTLPFCLHCLVLLCSSLLTYSYDNVVYSCCPSAIFACLHSLLCKRIKRFSGK